MHQSRITHVDKNPSNYYCNSHQTVSEFLNIRNLTIDLDGKLTKKCVSDDPNYKVKLLKLIALIIVGLTAHIVRKISYHHITVVGNTIYSRIISSCMSKCNISHVICKGSNRSLYYTTEDGTEIPFDGPNSHFFSNLDDDIIPIVPHSSLELNQLELHTKLKNLNNVQNTILAQFPIVDNVRTYKTKDFMINEENMKNPIIGIKRFFGGLYYIMTNNDVWVSKFIVSDNVAPLQPMETISCLYGKCVPNDSDKYNIAIRDSIECEISEPKIKTILSRSPGYQVNSDFTIKSIRKANCDENECRIYSLEHARPFSSGTFYIIHPFHLPTTWDPFLTIMIVLYSIFK